MSAELVRALVLIMHLVQHMHLTRAWMWVGCTKGWRGNCLMTVISVAAHHITVSW